ncbi:hypothetical protein D3C78_962330 [compost metagenome]
MGHRRGHLAKGDKGFAGHQLGLLRMQQARRTAHDPEQAEVDQRAAEQGRRPDQHIATLNAPHQVLRLLVHLHHRQHLSATLVEHRDVVLDEQVLRLTLELLFFAVFIGLVVTGRYRYLRMERLVEVVIADDLLTNQQRVGGPDNGPVQGIDIGQQGVGQVLDVVEELDTRGRRQVGADPWVLLVHPRIKQLRHGGARRNP